MKENKQMSKEFHPTLTLSWRGGIYNTITCKQAVLFEAGAAAPIKGVVVEAPTILGGWMDVTTDRLEATWRLGKLRLTHTLEFTLRWLRQCEQLTMFDHKPVWSPAPGLEYETTIEHFCEEILPSLTPQGGVLIAPPSPSGEQGALGGAPHGEHKPLTFRYVQHPDGVLRKLVARPHWFDSWEFPVEAGARFTWDDGTKGDLGALTAIPESAWLGDWTSRELTRVLDNIQDDGERDETIQWVADMAQAGHDLLMKQKEHDND